VSGKHIHKNEIKFTIIMKEIRTLNANEFIIKERKESNIYYRNQSMQWCFKDLNILNIYLQINKYSHGNGNKWKYVRKRNSKNIIP